MVTRWFSDHLILLTGSEEFICTLRRVWNERCWPRVFPSGLPEPHDLQPLYENGPTSDRCGKDNIRPVSILGFENGQSFFSYNCPCTYGVPQCAAHCNARRTAMRGAPQCAERTSLIGTTLAKLSKQLRNITYRQLFNKHTLLSCLFLKMVVYCNKQLCK